MLLTRTRYIPSRKTVDERIILTDATLLKKTTFFFLLLSFVGGYSPFTTPHDFSGKDVSGKNPAFFANPTNIYTIYTAPSDYLLSELLPRGRIFFEKFRPDEGYLPSGSAYYITTNPIINSKITCT